MNAVDHNNVVIFDDRGIPSIMCRFVRPKDTEEVPAVFKIGDKVADAIYISKYPNIVIDGRAYSMPMADPTVNITFDGAVQACRCKGLGWHLMTAVEYEYLLNQSREKGTMPHGNTDWGKDYYHNDEQGKVSNLGRTYTGTGPVTWNHDHTPYGVSDLNGNVWEWLAGLRIKDGVIEFIPDNKAASPYCDLSKDSAEWQQAETSKGPRGSYIYHAKAVSSQISDVSAESPQDGVADIRIMLYGGELPSEELIKEVQAYLSADDIRPMTDKVTVAAPTTVDFDIELTYYIPKDKEASTKEIKRAVDLAVESYELWQTSKMGRDINPSYFYAILMDSGIKRADIKKPVFTEIPKGSVAVLKKCTVTFGGVEDE